MTPELKKAKMDLNVSDYFGHATGNKGNRFYMQFYGDPAPQLTLVDADFMLEMIWADDKNNDSQ